MVTVTVVNSLVSVEQSTSRLGAIGCCGMGFDGGCGWKRKLPSGCNYRSKLDFTLGCLCCGTHIFGGGFIDSRMMVEVVEMTVAMVSFC